MSSIANNQLPFNDNAVNGNTVDQTVWNQLVQVLQTAINDNFYRIVEQFNLLNSDGTMNKQMNVQNTSGVTNIVQLEMGPGITITAVQNNGSITFTFAIETGAITEAQIQTGAFDDVFYTQTQLNSGQLDNRYYTQPQVQNLINSASYSKTVQTGNAFPANPVDGEQFYREDQSLLYTYSFIASSWLPAILNTAQTNIANTFTQVQTVLALSVTGLSGATGGGQYVGTTTTGQYPTSGTFSVNDWCLDRLGRTWTCTTAGTPGTWYSQQSNRYKLGF